MEERDVSQIITGSVYNYKWCRVLQRAVLGRVFMMTFNEGIWPSLWIGGRAGRRPSKRSRQRERHTQRPPGSFQELPGHRTAGSDGESSARQRCRARGSGQPPGGRHCLLHTSFTWLVHTHRLGLSSGIPFREAFLPRVGWVRPVYFLLIRKSISNLEIREEKWHFHSLPYCGTV